METQPDNNDEVDDSTCGFTGSTHRRSTDGASDTTSTFCTNAMRRLAPLKAQQVVKFASKSLEALGKCDEFRIQKGECVNDLPIKVHHFQFEPGDLLGQGTFSIVMKIKSSQIEAIEPSKHVLKMLRSNMVDDPDLFVASAAGLISEATILALLDHDNIIRVKAWSHRGFSGYSKGTSDAFFLVLDRLDGMLSDRICEWKHEVCKIHLFSRQRNEKLCQLLSKKLHVAKDIAGAISYLHQRRIIHRDIKPSNIGFQEQQVKLFDFDISRFLPPQSFEGQRFNMTALTGTRRYMSPENALQEPYNEKTDVYSFGMLLHEMITMEKAFPTLTRGEHELRVLKENMRPAFPLSFPRPIRLMIEAAWSRDIEIRPSMNEIMNELERACQHTSSRLRPCTRVSRQWRFRSVNEKSMFAHIVSAA
jgi:serine/threonine protein kinase